MRVVVASGKGGTGKTTVAVNLAMMAAESERSVAYRDCDVEEPNGHLFLKPILQPPQAVTVLVPRVDESRCSQCDQCGEVCQFKAIAVIGKYVIVNPDMCHNCGACRRVCPLEAISEVPYRVGEISTGQAKQLLFVQGVLDIGRAMAPPVIRAVKGVANLADWIVDDAPPGASCPAVETVRGADLVLLVAEPTPFGLHDLRIVVEMVRALGIPMAAVLNRVDQEPVDMRAYLHAQGIAILIEIPDERSIVECYARGELAGEKLPGFRSLINRLFEGLRALRMEVPA